MNLSAWAIHKPTPTVLLFLMITVAGIVAFKQVGIENFPELNFPSVTVSARLPGASPVQLQAEVARPIEDSIASIGGMRHITTTINDGAVNMMVEFEYDKGLQESVAEVRDAVTRIRSTLPAELLEPVVERVNIAGLPLLTYAVSATGIDEADLSWFVDDTVSKALLRVRGVAQVKRLGGVSREVRVEVDPARLQSLNLTVGELNGQLRSMQQEAPGGRSDLGGMIQAVRTMGAVSSASELASLSLPLSDGRRLQLSDIATVRDTSAERDQLALLNGTPVVSFQVFRARGFDEISTGARAREAVAQLQQLHPRVTIVEAWNTVDYSKAEFDVAMHMLYEGALLAVIIVWLFLRDWRATAISAVALPLSIIPTFVVLMMLGYTLNVLTLLAITLVIGVLVDDAIVEVENIMRHLGLGKTPLQAALDAVEEIGLAVVATSLTLVAVFLPTAFVSGLTGEMFQQFGFTASAAVLFSLLVARLLTPVMAAYLLKPQARPHAEGRVMRRYLKTVRWCLEHPYATSASAGAVFFGSLLLISQLPSGFIGAQDTSIQVVVLEAPPGSTLEQTAGLAERARGLLKDIPEVRSIYTAIGAGLQTGNFHVDGGAPDVRMAQLTVKLAPEDERERAVGPIQAEIRKALSAVPGVRINIGRGTPGEKMNLMLAGDEPQALLKASRAVEADLRTLRGIGAITSSASLMRPEIAIRPDFARAAELGITSAAIGEAVRVATIGDYNVNLNRLTLPGRQVYVRVQLDPESRRDPDLVAQLRVKGRDGIAVPLGNIAQIGVSDGPAQIDRYDRRRYVQLSVDLQGRPVGEVLKEAQALPALQKLPAGVELVVSGDLKYMQEMFAGFTLAIFAGIFCVYAVMVLLFHDFGQPITVLAALPLASCGALGFVWLFGFPLSMSALIGLLMLVGIVTKNSILLIEYAIMARRERGMGRTEAILDACQKRARPIVMTTVAMTAGMMPIAIGFDGDGSFRTPMAVVVIGGLLTSTVLSLLVIPVIFELVDDVKQALGRRWSRTAAASEA